MQPETKAAETRIAPPLGHAPCNLFGRDKMLEQGTPYRGSFQQLADARRVLKIATSLDRTPLLTVQDRQELARVRSLAIRVIEAASEELIETLDALHGDVDLEVDDPPEDDGTEEQAAWVERVNQTKPPYRFPAPADYRNHEDAEDDEGGGDTSGDEGEPAFDARSRRVANLGGEGAGCTINGDRELNGDEGDYGGEVCGV
jgi:hypothetical protein